jgi:hypothetical protein
MVPRTTAGSVTPPRRDSRQGLRRPSKTLVAPAPSDATAPQVPYSPNPHSPNPTRNTPRVDFDDIHPPGSPPGEEGGGEADNQPVEPLAIALKTSPLPALLLGAGGEEAGTNPPDGRTETPSPELSPAAPLSPRSRAVAERQGGPGNWFRGRLAPITRGPGAGTGGGGGGVSS